ncbi:MAG: hypothetical protein LBF68_04940 [Christensenellaceae bacterium]|jgi:hypothetical protein|nr:hypothetical protein [Christensenellaceae bacterium]
MKGTVVLDNWGKLRVKGEDNKFYSYSKTLGEHVNGDPIDFEVVPSEYNGRVYLWASKPKQSNVPDPNKPVATSTNLESTVVPSPIPSAPLPMQETPPANGSDLKLDNALLEKFLRYTEVIATGIKELNAKLIEIANNMKLPF